MVVRCYTEATTVMKLMPAADLSNDSTDTARAAACKQRVGVEVLRASRHLRRH